LCALEASSGAEAVRRRRRVSEVTGPGGACVYVARHARFLLRSHLSFWRPPVSTLLPASSSRTLPSLPSKSLWLIWAVQNFKSVTSVTLPEKIHLPVQRFAMISASKLIRFKESFLPERTAIKADISQIQIVSFCPQRYYKSGSMSENSFAVFHLLFNSSLFAFDPVISA
jgi:hypothetical protein